MLQFSFWKKFYSLYMGDQSNCSSYCTIYLTVAGKLNLWISLLLIEGDWWRQGCMRWAPLSFSVSGYNIISLCFTLFSVNSFSFLSVFIHCGFWWFFLVVYVVLSGVGFFEHVCIFFNLFTVFVTYYFDPLFLFSLPILCPFFFFPHLFSCFMFLAPFPYIFPISLL